MFYYYDIPGEFSDQEKMEQLYTSDLVKQKILLFLTTLVELELERFIFHCKHGHLHLRKNYLSFCQFDH